MKSFNSAAIIKSCCYGIAVRPLSNFFFVFIHPCRNPSAISAENVDYDYIPLLITVGRKKKGMRTNRTNIAIASITNFSPAKIRLWNY